MAFVMRQQFLTLVILSSGVSATERPHTACDLPEGLLLFEHLPHSTMLENLKEVHFKARTENQSQKRQLCKFRCSQGVWTGPFCRDKSESVYNEVKQRCRLDSVPNQLVLSSDLKTVSLPDTFAHNTRLRARCAELGMYKHTGAVRMVCRNGLWRPHKLPTCQPTSILTNFTRGTPPTIVHHVPSGVVQLSGDGRLMVYPGSIVHLDCLYLRTDGQPQWRWSANFRKYPLGWAINSNDREWKYRLSIYYARTNDTGRFRCQTPEGASNHIKIVVKSVQCPAVKDVDKNLRPGAFTRRMGETVRFSCTDGFQLVGVPTLTCLANGRWSAATPRCQRVECSLLSVTDPRLVMQSFNVSQGGRAVFSCVDGFQLVGDRVILCQLNGTWTAPLPSCRAVTCPEPRQPLHGYLIHSGKSRVDEVVEYLCHPDHVMTGQPSSVCLASGQWSNPTPNCDPVCEFPGTPADGAATPVLFSYRVGETVNFQCAANHMLLGMESIMCQGDSSWSGEVPECRKFFKLSNRTQSQNSDLQTETSQR